MRLRGGIKHLFLALAYAGLGLVVTGLILFVGYMRDRPELSAWHTAVLDAEFTAAKAAKVSSLAAYRELEEALFRQLREEAMPVAGGQQLSGRLNRYMSGSLVDPTSYPINWNRTFELSVEDPAAGYLLLHGLSDAPYSLRAIGQRLHTGNSWVVGLRLPGHGTAPVGLARVDWQDFTAAVRMAMLDMRARLGPDKPLYLVGYSNGAALAIHYSLTALEDPQLPKPAGLLLFSPALAVSPTAALAKWSLWLAQLPGMEKLAWLSIQPEYDPYKYNSFSVNAGEQVYRLTNDVAERIRRLDRGGGVEGFPPVLAFQSVVDATILPEALVQRLFAHLAPDGHELVLFDINREAETNAFFAKDPRAGLESLFGQPRPFAMTLVTNHSPDTLEVMALHRDAGSDQLVQEQLGLAWPQGIFSLSHVALPIPPEDPIYGAGLSEDAATLTLGAIDLRGETGVLQVPLSQLQRLRYNPFYSYLEQRVAGFAAAAK